MKTGFAFLDNVILAYAKTGLPHEANVHPLLSHVFPFSIPTFLAPLTSPVAGSNRSMDFAPRLTEGCGGGGGGICALAALRLALAPLLPRVEIVLSLAKLKEDDDDEAAPGTTDTIFAQFWSSSSKGKCQRHRYLWTKNYIRQSDHNECGSN